MYTSAEISWQCLLSLFTQILLFICTYIKMHVHRYFPLYDALTGVTQRALCHGVLVRYKIHL